jgi:hypothetical protein
MEFFILFAIIVGVGGFVLKALLLGYAAKNAMDAYGGASASFQHQLQLMNALLAQAHSQPSARPSDINAQLLGHWGRLQGQLSHMDRVSRDRLENRLNDIRSQAASVGISLD